MTILEDLDWRSLVADCTDRIALKARLDQGPLTVYCGFDPTADSLHVGNLVPLLALKRFQADGHVPIALAGGATGAVGDPSGKSDERPLLTSECIQHNIDSIKIQLEKFLDFSLANNAARIVNNAEWTSKVTYLDFLRNTGRYFTVNWMVAKESVRARMEDREKGISYTEFSYMLLQAFDFYHLNEFENCELQIGATDQWGNITAGIELCRKKGRSAVWGLTFPLLTKSDGSKYGKTAAGTVWLDPKKTSPYRFYQYFVQTEDAEVIKLLKTLTFLSKEEISVLDNEIKNNPSARVAQKKLAEEMTTLVHGYAEYKNAERASNALFTGSIASLPHSQFSQIVTEIPSARTESLVNKTLTEAVVISGLCPSKGQARNLIASGGIYLNDTRQQDPNHKIGHQDLLHDNYLLLRKGASNYYVLMDIPAGVAPPQF